MSIYMLRREWVGFCVGLKRVFPCISLSFVVSFKFKLALAAPSTLKASTVHSEVLFSHSLLDHDKHIEAETLLCMNFVSNIFPNDPRRVCLDPMAEGSTIMQSTDVCFKMV